MEKDAYYFSHDANAKDDPKCMQLIDQLGLEGYGIFWVLVETLREQRDFKYELKLVPILARRYANSKEKFFAVINNYDLFEIEDDKFFFSNSLNRRMKKYLDGREKKRIAGRKGANKRWQNYSIGNGSAIAEDSKVKESKVKENNISAAHDDSDSNIDEIQNLWIRTVGKNPNNIEREETTKLIDKFSIDEVETVFRTAAKNRAKAPIAYVTKILNTVDKPDVIKGV